MVMSPALRPAVTPLLLTGSWFEKIPPVLIRIAPPSLVIPPPGTAGGPRRMAWLVQAPAEKSPLAEPLLSKRTEPSGCAEERLIAAGGGPLPPEALMVIAEIAVSV